MSAEEGVRRTPLLIVLALAGLLAFNSCDTSNSQGGQLNQQKEQNSTSGVPAGFKKTDGYMSMNTKARPAPDFTVVTTDGVEMNLSSLRGKVILLDFWATYCGPCRDVMVHLEGLHKKYGGMGLVVIGVSTDAQKDGINAFAQSLGITYYLAPANSKILKDYGGINFIPTSFLIDRKGNLINKYSGGGPLSEREMDKDVTAILPQ